jgi:hypothetical protein
MCVVLADGRTLDIAIRAADSMEDAPVTLLEVLQPRFFDRCPICRVAAATEREDLPPRRIGGTVMTRTCKPCNNKLGSLVEADLVDWFEDAITLPYLRADGVRGRRSAGRLLWRTTSDGQFALVIDGEFHPDLPAMLASGEVDLEACRPARNRYSIALMKSAYLALCLKYGVPEGDAADQIRRDLLAARDAANKNDVPISEMALRLTIARLYGPMTGTVAPVIRAVLDDDGGAVEGVILAGRIFVSWSSTRAGRSHAPADRLIRHLHVGTLELGTLASATPLTPRREHRWQS